jgi:predicted transcriptional regulator
VTVSAEVHAKVERLAREQNRSASRVLEQLITTGLTAKESERRRLYDLIERLRATDNPDEKQRLGDELGRMVFGD